MKFFKKALSIVAIGLCGFTFSGCSSKADLSLNKLEEVNIVDDNYRNYYEIFVASFYDSNGDGMGDLNGVIERLDYIEAMGYTGIWLMPIHKSPSYHKYDVTDYYSVDENYGTMEDLENLISECHKRNINLILDLVINHTSTDNEWFIQAKKIATGTKTKYYDWYNFSSQYQKGYNSINSSCYYEGVFGGHMPDLNLDNEEVRAEIVNIMKFWLDKGIDGFRLDTVINYYTDNESKNIEFMTWLNQEAKKLKNDCYLVGEAWTAASTIESYYSSGIDSFFAFANSGAEGYIANMFKSTKPASLYQTAITNINSMSSLGIAAPFLDNHDLNRIAGALNREHPERIKFAQGLLSMMNGAIFNYYGDEIAMTGSGRDENKRLAMSWSLKDKTGMCNSPQAADQTFTDDSVENQLKDENSILKYFQKSLTIRNKYPEIARGENTFVDSLCNKSVCVIKRVYEGSTIYIVLNCNSQASIELDLSVLGNVSMQDYLVTDVSNKIENDGSNYTMPALSIAIFK